LEVLIGSQVYVVGTNEHEEFHIKFGKIAPIRCKFSELPPDNWIKVLLVDDPKTINRVIDFTDAHPCEQVHLVRSAPMFYEVLPKGVNKATGFKKLLEIMELNGYYIVAAGDYMNDLEMVQQADLGVAVNNAEQIVKDFSDIVVCDNNSGVIHEIVNYLNKRIAAAEQTS
jgi:hydroxymethylpyrimidine pyrophosphatase-like HAD family hydrolase